jgi:hypothetical protein
MKHRRYLVYADHVWLPPWIPPNHGRLRDHPQWFLGGLPENQTGIFPLSAFPDRYWLIVRGKEVAPPVISPPKRMGPDEMTADPCHGIVSTDELAALIDLGYVIDVYEGPYWSRADVHRLLDRFWKGADRRPMRFPCNPMGNCPMEKDDAEYFWFDGAPVRIADQRALQIAEGKLVPVSLDDVRAKGDRISRHEFEVCWYHSKRIAKEQES